VSDPTDPATKAEFLATMQAERAQWEALLAAIGEARMTEPGVAGHWSVKDVVAHISAYERWILEQLEALARNETPPPSLMDDNDMERRNTIAHEQTRDLALSVILADAQHTYDQLAQLVANTPEADLMETQRALAFVKAHWGNDTALWGAVAGLTYGHYDEHLADLRAWRDQGKA